MPKKNAVYKCPRSAFLKLWNTVHKNEGTLTDLVQMVCTIYDPMQGSVDGKKPEFTLMKARQKCDRIIAYAEENKKPIPSKLPGHDSLLSQLDEMDW